MYLAACFVDLFMQFLRLYSPPSRDFLAANLFLYVLWFFLGSPLFSCSLIPGSRWRVFILRLFLAKIDYTCTIKPSVKIKYPWKLSVGSYSWLGERTWIDNIDFISIGSNVCISQDCYLCTGNHNYRSKEFSFISSPITIKDHVWICARTTVAPGTTIEQSAVVMIGSVVISDIQANSVSGGNPAVKLKERI